MDARLQRYKKQYRDEKRVNEELGKRLHHWKRIAAKQAIELETLKQDLRDARSLRHRPVPAIVDSLEVSPTSSLTSLTAPPPATPPRGYNIDRITPPPQQCSSPKFSTPNSSHPRPGRTATNDLTLSHSLRSSNATNLIRSVWRTSGNQLDQQQNQPRPPRPAASAFFVAGPSYIDVTTHHRPTLTPLLSSSTTATPSPDNTTTCCQPQILHATGNVHMVDNTNANHLPSLVENMCFPKDVPMVPTPSTSSKICSVAPVSLFCLSVVRTQQKSTKENNNGGRNEERGKGDNNQPDDEEDDDDGPTALYGIYATVDPGGQLSVVEHPETGVLLHVPFVVCVLTYEATELRRLSTCVRAVVHMEEERMRLRLQNLRRGSTGSDGSDGSDGGAMHVVTGSGRNGIEQYGALSTASRQKLEQFLNTNTITTTTRTCSLRPNLLPLFEWGGAHLFSTMSIERCLVLLGCALTEQKIIFVSKHTSRLGSSVLAFVSLLSPLTWCGPLVPILPRRLYHILEAPFPLIAGVVGLDKEQLQLRQDDSVIVNLDKGRILLPTTVNRNYIAFKLPNCDHLSHELTTMYEESGLDRKNTRRGSRRRRTPEEDTKILMQMTSVVQAKVKDILQSVSVHLNKDHLQNACDGSRNPRQCKNGGSGGDGSDFKSAHPFLSRAAETQMFDYWQQQEG